jgi:methionine-rich copper-binding protein CopC
MLTRLGYLRRGILAAVVVLAPAAASAHAMLHSSDPADGSTLNSSPRALHLRFTEECRVTSLRLLDQGGKEHQIRREGGREAASHTTATVPASLPPGAYRIEWRAMGSDGHVMSGAVRFAVNVSR